MTASFWDAAFVSGCLQDMIENTPGLTRGISYVREGGAKTVDGATLARSTGAGGGAVALNVIRLDFEGRPGPGGKQDGDITWLLYKATADASPILGPNFQPKETDQVVDDGITYQVMAWDYLGAEQGVFVCGKKVGC